jgi:hypothetical protein
MSDMVCEHLLHLFDAELGWLLRGFRGQRHLDRGAEQAGDRQSLFCCSLWLRAGRR